MHLIFTKCSGSCFSKFESYEWPKSLLNYRKLIMRTIVSCLLLSISGLLHANDLSGQDLSKIDVNLTFKNEKLKDAFSEFEKNTSIRFTSKSRDIARYNNVNYNPNEEKLDVVLKTILNNTDLEIKQINDDIVVNKNKKTLKQLTSKVKV